MGGMKEELTPSKDVAAADKHDIAAAVVVAVAVVADKVAALNEYVASLASMRRTKMDDVERGMRMVTTRMVTTRMMMLSSNNQRMMWFHPSTASSTVSSSCR